jgi:cytoskeletal protein RodZ
VAVEPIADAAPTGGSPWRLAWRRLRRNRVALGFLGLFALIVVFVLAAPLWANEVADTGPNTTHTLQKSAKSSIPKGGRSAHSGSTRAESSSSAPTGASAATRWCG